MWPRRLCVLAFVGCAQGLPTAVELDPGASPPVSAERATVALLEAVAWWQACGEDVRIGGSDVRMTFGDTSKILAGTAGVHVDHDIEISNDWEWKWEDEGTACVPEEGRMSLSLALVMAHEIGHELGYVHVLDPAQLMYAYVGQCDRLRYLPCP